MTLSSHFTVQVRAALTRADAIGATARDDLLSTYAKTLVSGTAAGQADRIWRAQRTIAASGTDDLDLAGPLVDALGGTAAFVTVKAIAVIAGDGNANNVVVGGAANPFIGPLGGTNPTVTVRPGGVYFVAAPGAGWTVTAGTGDILRLTNGGGGSSIICDVIVVGTSA